MFGQLSVNAINANTKAKNFTKIKHVAIDKKVQRGRGSRESGS